MDFRNSRSAMATWSRIANQQSTSAAALVATIAAFQPRRSYIGRMTRSSMITIGAVIRPAM
jgi:hypothetical protein